MTWKRRCATAAMVVAIAAGTAACRRTPRLSDDAYRQAVTAFYVSLAAMETSQDALARQELDRVVQLAPHEPAGWANLGLLLLRQQQADAAAERLTKAAELAPDDAAIARLLALNAGRRGAVDEAVRNWRRAMQLDAADLDAPFALAQELERIGGDSNLAEAQKLFASIADRTGNLAALLELARLAARRGDAVAVGRALAELDTQSAAWPEDARARLQAVRDSLRQSAAAAATPLIFLKNVLIRQPVYRAAFAQLTAPRGEIGEPLVRLVSLPNPPPQPAEADAQLTFTVGSQPSPAVPDAQWAAAVWLTADRPVAAAAGAREVRVGSGAVILSAPLAPGPAAIAAADLNYDFRTDLAVALESGVQIFQQTDQNGFANVTAAARLPADAAGAAAGVWPADIDTDGDLDLVVARRDRPAVVLRNNGDGSFATLATFGAVARLRAFAWADLDGEGVPDAALLDESGTLRVFANLRGGLFRELSMPAVARIAAIAPADTNADGVMDLVGVAADGAVVTVTFDARSSHLRVETLTRVAPLADLSPGTAVALSADLDNNGAVDFVVSSASASRVVLVGPRGGFVALDPGALPGAVAAAADLDADGRLDLVVRAADGARLARSTGGRQYRWQAIRPRAMTATGDQRINSFGIGGEVEVRSGLHAQRQVIAAPVVHFGLGDAGGAEVARITWPNGVLQSEFTLAANAVVAATQRLKGSCPWLFAWDGEAMRFVTDFIWRSPLGLRINAQATADVQMTEDWVRIRGDQLRPRSGEYDLRITAELWETHFFDLTSLLVVDHPEGTEVFVDERFAVPAPRLGVTAMSPVQELAVARDDGGRDVSEVVRARDDRHLDFAGRGAYQGITRDHYVELELPPSAPRDGPLWLVAQGWVHPTDSSINVALGQGRHAPPSGLSLQVADAAGRFRVVRSGLGFPAGKDKTVLIELARVFPASGPRRLRLATNLEIFWDRIGWASGRPDVELTPQRLTLTRAELRPRGYSVTAQPNASTPERPRYELAGVAPRWRDLEGFHTRFGDVRELLAGVDDRYVIMNAGDELRLAFPEAAPPKPGYVRDFVLIGDGWVKDGDFNTVASRTVLPLPTHRSPAYTPGTGRLEDDPVYQRHREDFERYHTRFVTGDAARDALRVKIDPERPRNPGP